jgi:CHAT domain-containing protein
MPFFIIFNTVKSLRLYIIGLIIPLNFYAQTLDADYKKLYARLEKGENLKVADFQKLLDQYRKQLQNFPDESAELYYYRGNYLYAEGKTDEAVQSFNGAYTFAMQAKDTTFKYYVILAFARISYNNKIYAKSEEYYSYALPGLAVVYGQSSKEYTKIYFEYVRLLVQLDRLKEAKPLLEALQYYYETMKMFDDPTYLAVVGNLGYVLQEMGSYKEALAKYNSIIENDKLLKAGDTLEHVVMLSNIGETYREMGYYNEALSNLQTAKRFIQKYKLPDVAQAASIENNLGLLYKGLNDFKNSEKSFNNALKIYKDSELEDTEPYCSTLSNKSDLLRMLGRKDEGLKLLDLALKTREKYFGKNSENYANALSNYGLILYEMGEMDRALDHFKEAYDIYKTTISNTHQSFANCLNNLASCYYYNGDYKKAEQYKFEAIDIVEKTLGKEHYKYISFELGTFEILIATGQYQRAINLITEASVLAKKKFGVNHDLYIRALINLASAKLFVRKYEESVSLFEEAIERKMNGLNSFFYVMSREDQVLYLEELQYEFSWYSTVLFNYSAVNPEADLKANYEKYLNFHISLKSLLNKNSMEWQKKANESKDPSVIATYQKWKDLKSELNDLYKGDFAMELESQLIEKINQLESNLKTGIDLKPQVAFTFKSLKEQLNDGEAVVDISKYTEMIDSTRMDRYAALVVQKNSIAPKCVFLSKERYNDEKAANYYNDKMDELVVDSVSYGIFYKELDKALGDATKVYVSAKGIYNRINLQTLYDPETKKYLIETKEIVSVPDLNAIASLNEKGNTDNTAQLFGNPDFNYDFRKKVQVKTKPKQELIAKRFGLTSISDLPGTETELTEMVKSLTASNWKVKSYKRIEASEENIRKVRSPKLLHIATHGYFLKDVESTDKKFLGFNTQKFKQLADVRSGLILAGAAINTSDSVKVSSDKDGILTSREASVLDLSGTDLVVLSACQTGLGEETLNNGVIGLQQAFSNAGAKNLILSLWPVDDNATQLLMVKFYEYWLKDASNQNISSAFKKAQLDVKQKFPHPYYWGAFVLLKN